MFHFIPFLRLRASEEAEILGIDESYTGEATSDLTDILHQLHVSSSSHSTAQYTNVVARTKSAGDQPESPGVSSNGNEKQPGGGRVDV